MILTKKCVNTFSSFLYGCLSSSITLNTTIDKVIVNVIAKTEIFEFATDFDHSLGHWNTSQVTDISRMFSGANRFNSHIGSWDVSKVTSMQNTFFAAQVFNQPLASWVTLSLSNLNETFVAAL